MKLHLCNINQLIKVNVYLCFVKNKVMKREITICSSVFNNFVWRIILYIKIMIYVKTSFVSKPVIDLIYK